MKPLQIFKKGKHTAMSGVTLSFSENDVRTSISEYDPDVHQAPLVIGHPKTDDPAYGWVKSLSYVDGIMEALPEQVDPAFAKMVNEGKFKKISASFYPPDSPNNPKPGIYYLKHVGFLGAAAPAIKGLKSASFAEDEDYIEVELDFSEFCQCQTNKNKKGKTLNEEELKAREAALAEREAKLKLAEATSFIEGIRTKIPPIYRNGLIEFIASLDAEQEIEFSEGGKTKKLPSAAFIKDLLSHLPNLVEFKEVATGQTPDPETDPHKIAIKARQYVAEQKSKGIEISYTEAVSHIIGGD
jgi:hypothetical protein